MVGCDNHQWNINEDRIQIECLVEHYNAWRGDNGFKHGFHKHFEKKILEKMHECTLKSTLHIESRVKQLKKHYNAICEMKGPRGGSGFGWNDKDKMIVVEKEILKNG